MLILFVLQNCSMLKSHYILPSIEAHRIQLLFFVLNSMGFHLQYSDLMYTKEMDCKTCPFVRKG